MHAILIQGTFESVLATLPLHLQKEGPDVLHYRTHKMGIDDVRALTEEAYLTPFSGLERVFLLAYTTYTPEAQNALLKLLEEPPKTARFYIITESPDFLLPTLRSRLLSMGEIHTSHTGQNIESFLCLTPRERLEIIGEKATKKDEAWQRALMAGFEEWAHTSHEREFTKSLLALLPAFNSQGASKKMILEHLALLLP